MSINIHKNIKFILIYADSEDSAGFYLRMLKSIEECGYQAAFIVDSLQIYLMVRKQLKNVIFIKKVSAIDGYGVKDLNYKNCLEVKLKKFSEQKAYIMYFSAYKYVENFIRSNEIECVFNANGTRCVSMAIKNVVKKNNITQLFFELANLPHRVFVDHNGTNVYSSIGINISILDLYDDNKEKYYNWRQNYIESKLKFHVVPQARNIYRRQIIYNLFGVMGFFYTGLSTWDVRYLMYRFQGIIAKINNKIQYDNVDLSALRYVFFPLQVSTDSQILIHSDIDLFTALEKAFYIAKEKGINLVVKPHPEETDFKVIRKILDIKQKTPFYFVNDNTFEIIQNAEEVVTINSTVGLESMILEKPVQILGRAIYKDFDQSRLRKYVLSYLVDVDYYGKETISKNVLKLMLNRALGR